MPPRARSYARRPAQRSSWSRTRRYPPLSRYVPSSRTTTVSARRSTTMRLPGFIRFQLTWVGDQAMKYASNGTTWSASNFPGFNGVAATYDEYRIKSITYRVRSEYNSIFGPGVQEDASDSAPIYIDPVMVVADVTNNFPDQAGIIAYQPSQLLTYSNAQIFRGTRYSSWRTIYPRPMNPTSVPITETPMFNVGATIDAKQWQPTDLAGLQHAPLTLVSSEDIEVNSAYDPQSRYPQFIIEAYATFEFRSAR